MTAPLLKTPLYEEHVALGGKMVPFAGYLMPVRYTGDIAEHEAVRTRAGLFDVSHMGEFSLTGDKRLEAIQHLVTNDVSKLQVGDSQYTALCYPNGTVVDDLIVNRIGEYEFLICVNASNMEKDFAWMTEHLLPDAKLENLSDGVSLLALQGPAAKAILPRVIRGYDVEVQRRFSIAEAGFGSAKVLVARTGYTGEDGFEIYVHHPQAVDLWRALLEAGKPEGLIPCGLGARDSLRLEAGLLLYGQDMDDTVTAIEAGLGWVVKEKKGDFIGREVLAQQKAEGAPRKIIGLLLEGKGIPRHGYPVLSGGRQVGVITSGLHSPTLKRGIGMALVETAAGAPLTVDVRGREIPATITPLPFYKKPV